MGLVSNVFAAAAGVGLAGYLMRNSITHSPMVSYASPLAMPYRASVSIMPSPFSYTPNPFFFPVSAYPARPAVYLASPSAAMGMLGIMGALSLGNMAASGINWGMRSLFENNHQDSGTRQPVPVQRPDGLSM